MRWPTPTLLLMADEKIFADGVRLFPKHEKAPDWVIGTLIITPNDLITWLKANPHHLTDYNGSKQLKLQLTKSQAGKLVASVDTWRPDAAASKPTPQNNVENVDDLPF